MNKYLDDLSIFCEVMRHKSYSKAADAVRVSKSHVSKSVVRLEDNLGVQLFERNSRRITSTLVAEELYRQLDTNLNDINRTLNDIRSAQFTPKGRIRITAAGEYGEQFITQKSIDFIKRYPDVEFDIIFSNHVLDLAENHIDIAIRTGTLANSDLIARPITYRRLTTVCSPEYIKLYGTPRTISELKSHKCLIGSSDQWVFQHGGEMEHLKVWGKWQSNNGNALTLAALSGLGIAQIPGIYTQPHIAEGRLVECLMEYQATESPVWAVFRKKSTNTLIVRKFVDFLICSS